MFLSWFRKAKSANRERTERYSQIRAAGRALNVELAKLLPKAAVPEHGKKLGLVKAGTLVLNNEDEIAILYDYAIHAHRFGEKSVRDRYLESHPAPEPLVTEVLEAMNKAWFSVFRVEHILPGLGAHLRDLISGTELELTDMGLAGTGQNGLLLCGRILPLSDFNMSSGTLLPVSELTYTDRLTPVIGKFYRDDRTKPLSHTQVTAFSAQVIRVALQNGGEDASFFTDITQ